MVNFHFYIPISLILIPITLSAAPNMASPSLNAKRSDTFNQKKSNPNFYKAKGFDFIQYYKDSAQENLGAYTNDSNGIVKRYGANNIAVSSGTGSTVIVNQIISGNTYTFDSDNNDSKSDSK